MEFAKAVSNNEQILKKYTYSLLDGFVIEKIFLKWLSLNF